jgi:ethanolamine permease
MISLFVLRRKAPLLDRPFKVPAYPYFPAIALLLSAVCLVAIVWYNVVLSCWFFVGLLVVIGIFGWRERGRR